MEFQVYSTSETQENLEKAILDFKRDLGWSGWRDAEKLRAEPCVLLVGEHPDNAIKPVNYLLRIDGGNIITRQGRDIVEGILEKREIPYNSRPVEVEDPSLLMTQIDYSF